jgi:uncharacterized lipoprotein YmbA
MTAHLPSPHRLLAPLLALALGACASSPPTRYYTLLPSGGAPTAADAGYQIEVMPVDVPAQVDVPQMVVRTSGGEVVPVDTRRWIAPLPDELRSALSWQLTHALGARDVAGFSKDASTPTYRVNLRVQRFDSAPGAYARIDAVWSVRAIGRDTAAPAVCSSSANITVTSGYAELAQGHQQALAKIAGEIAASIRAAQASGKAPACGASTG